MRLYPAIDVKDGQCVRLKKGLFNEVTVYSERPYEIAKGFEEAGAQFIHTVAVSYTHLDVYKRQVYDSFIKRYKRINDKTGKEQFVVPYLMSSHPGSTMKEAIELAEYVRDLGYMPEQVQDFYPTPSTLSTCMYYTGSVSYTHLDVYKRQLQKICHN